MLESIKKYLADNDAHLTSHDGAGYCYLTNNDFDYRGVLSYPIDAEEAYENGWVSFVDGELIT